MMKIVMAEMMSAVMERAKVMHVAKMTACPVSRIEMMANARMAHRAATPARVGNSRMPSADMAAVCCASPMSAADMPCTHMTAAAAENTRSVPRAERSGMADVRMSAVDHLTVADPRMTSAEVRVTA